MPVEDKYVSDFISGNFVNKLLPAINAHGAHVHALFATEEIAAADDDGSKYRFFKNLDPNLIPLAIMVGNDAITGGTNYDVGLYRPDLGTVLNKSVFAEGLDMSAAAASLNPKTAKDGMKDLAIENYGRRLFEHAGHTVLTKLEAYDLVLTADTCGTAAGTISVLLLVAQG